MISYRDLVTSLRALDLDADSPVILHVSLAEIGEINGGVDTILGAILATFNSVLTPVFTLRTKLIPMIGPQENGMNYGSGKISNSRAEFYRSDMPADRGMGGFAESLRRLPQTRRSTHPILSFAGINADAHLAAQSLEEPLGPLHSLLDEAGWAILLGASQKDNTSIHLAEQLEGRKQFVRWALTPYGVIECPNMPGCAQGFEAIAPRLRRVTRQVQAGESVVQAVPLVDLIRIARAWIQADSQALLCEDAECTTCQAVRKQIVKV